jgi:subtilisin family serine protease
MKRRVLFGIAALLVVALVAVAGFAVYLSLPGRAKPSTASTHSPVVLGRSASSTAGAFKPSRTGGGAGAGPGAVAKLGAVTRPAGPPVPASVTLKYAPSASASARSALLASLGVTVKYEFPGGWVVVETTRPGVTSASLAAAIQASGAVATSTPTPRVTPAALPNDPLLGTQWDLLNTGQAVGGQTGIAGDDIGWLGVWNRGSTGAGVIVADTDTGIDFAHEDLATQMWSNPTPGSDPRYPGDVRGWNWVEGSGLTFQPWDGDEHGTHTAGTIAAATNNGLGIAGIAGGARIMSLKFIGPSSGSEADAISAIDYAIAHGAKVINASWGDGTYSGPYQPLQDAIDRAAKAGVLFVAAAGNDGRSSSVALFYPAAYSLVETNVIAVAATDNRDALASFSNYGSYPQLAAPGVITQSSVPPYQAGIYIDDSPYRVSYLTFPVESITATVTRNAVVDRAMAALTSNKTQPVLVVDDSRADLTGETQGARLQKYTDALTAVGYTSVTTRVTATQGVPSAATMSGRTVVWFTGILDSMTGNWPGVGSLSTTDTAQIGPFLDGGGRLFLSSASAAWDLGSTALNTSTISNPGWLYGYLHVDIAANANTSIAVGRWDSAFAGLAPALSDPRLNVRYCDAVLPRDGFAARTMDWDGSGYAQYSGTSMATPHVTGVVALLNQRFPGITATQVKNRILATVHVVPALSGKVTTSGRLDVSAALAPYAAHVTGFGGVPTTDGTITLSWTNPVDPGVYERTVILGRVGVDPTSPVDPASRLVYSGTGSTVKDTGLADGTQMHYMAYTHSTTGLWSDASR